MNLESLPMAAYAAALAGFQRMNVHRLGALLRHLPPDEAFAVAAGWRPSPPGTLMAKLLDAPDGLVRDAWAASARHRVPAAVWAGCCALGVDVTYVGHPDHPQAALDDPLLVPVLFSRGDRNLLNGRRVAIVGTRNATLGGREVAFELGRGLAHADVHVVSGLARGIDVHAHRGVVDAMGSSTPGNGRPIAVVASGLDCVYPREHARIWERVATDGLLLSECPPGTGPVAHQFPLRNRLVAGLSEIVIVVESRERGGSLITAMLAAERGVPVMAVPGSARSRAAVGVNELLRDGAAPVLGPADVLLALSLDHTRTAPVVIDVRVPPRRGDVAVHRVCVRGPATIGEIADLAGVDILDAAMALARLEQQGWLVQVDGWYESVGSPPR